MISKLLKKYADVLPYMLFGILTTVANFAVFYPLYNLYGLSITVSNWIAWVASVIFAFLTNKPFVFKSHDWSAKVLFPELARFVGCRVGSLLMETGLLFLTDDCLHWNGNWMKLLTSVLVVIWNYVGSRLLVFRKK